MERKKNQKKFLLFNIIAFEPGSTNSHNPEQDTSHWQSICYQGTLRFNISLMEAYSRASCIRLMKKNKKSALMKILQEFGNFNMFTVKECSETVFFRGCSNQVFDSL